MKQATIMKGSEVVLSRCEVTESAWERMCGLLPKAGLGEGEGLWIAPCTSIHTFFMRFAIDVAFLDKSGKVLAIYSSMVPWRLSGIHFRAAGALEAPAGAFARAGIKKGEILTLCLTS